MREYIKSGQSRHRPRFRHPACSGAVAREKQRGLGDVVRLAETTERNCLLNACGKGSEFIWSHSGLAVDRRVHRARADGVDSNMAIQQLA